MKAVCTVKIAGWAWTLPTLYQVRCNRCQRHLGSFSQHESAMAWAQAHAMGSKHIRG